MKEGRKEGKKERKKEGRKEGRKERKKEGHVFLTYVSRYRFPFGLIFHTGFHHYDITFSSSIFASIVYRFGDGIGFIFHDFLIPLLFAHATC